MGKAASESGTHLSKPMSQLICPWLAESMQKYRKNKNHFTKSLKIKVAGDK